MRNSPLFDPGLIACALLTLLVAALAARADPAFVIDVVPNPVPGPASMPTPSDTSARASPPQRLRDDGIVLRAWPGTGTGLKVSQGGLLLPQLSFSAALLEVVEAEVVVGQGACVAPTLSLDGRGVEMINRFSFGLRWFLPIDGVTSRDVGEPVRPFLWTAVHHGHKVQATDVVKNPIGALLTSTDAGVAHLTGLEGGAGLLLALPIDDAVFPLLLRVSASWLPSFVAVSHDHPAGSAAPGDDVLLLVDVAIGLPLGIDDG